MRRRVRRRGFVLLFVIFLIVFCSLILTGISRATLRTNLYFSTRLADLQRRWGRATLEQVLLENPSQWFDAPIDKSLVGNRIDTQVEIGGFGYQIVLMNEQAKANLSTLLNNRSKQYLENRLKFDLDLPWVNLMPTEDDPANLGTTVLNSWGQVFELQGIDRNSLSEFLLNATENITLWGKAGRLQFRKSTDKALDLILRLAISKSKSKRWIQLFNENRNLDLNTISKSAGLTDKETANLGRLLTEESNCYSLMLITERTSKRNFRYTIRETVGSQNRTWVFQW